MWCQWLQWCVEWGVGRGLDQGWDRWVVLCLCEVWVWIICVDNRSRYMCIVLGGYLHIWGAPSVQSCCTLWISTFWHVFVYDWYHTSRLVCLKLSDRDWSRHHPLLWAAAPAIQRVRIAGMPQNIKSGRHCWGRFVSAVTAPPLVDCVVWSQVRHFNSNVI